MQRQSTSTPAPSRPRSPLPGQFNPCDDPEWQTAWDAPARRLVEVAAVPDGSRPGANARWRCDTAAALLGKLEEVAVGGMVDAELRVWVQVGRALMATGQRRLWAALYAIGPGGQEDGYRSGDELDYLEFHRDLVLPERPKGWPWPWLD